MWTAEGGLDVAVGVDPNEPNGTADDGTVARFSLTSNGTEGITRLVFRPDSARASSTFIADIFAKPVPATQLDSQDIVIDGTAPCIQIVSIEQNGVEFLTTDASIVPGVVHVVVEANDVVAGLAGPPDVNFAGIAAQYVGETSGGSVCGRTFCYEVVIGACTPPNGEYKVAACATDRAGSAACDEFSPVKINANEITGVIELEGLAPPAGGVNRRVVFVGTGDAVRKVWNVDVNFPAGSSKGQYTLADVPDGVTALSAKTTWNLRRKIAVAALEPCGRQVVDFVGNEGKLWAGDSKYGTLMDDNMVDVLDFAVWMICLSNGSDAADWNGDGKIDLLDYDLYSGNFFKTGDPE
jgi:hypothetical protein